jgi:hypothetical protein
VGVDHPGDDEVARAVDALGISRCLGDDPAVGDGEIAAAELASAGVDQAVLEQQSSAHDGRA